MQVTTINTECTEVVVDGFLSKIYEVYMYNRVTIFYFWYSFQ